MVIIDFARMISILMDNVNAVNDYSHLFCCHKLRSITYFRLLMHIRDISGNVQPPRHLGCRMQIKCFPDTCKEIYEFGNISRDCCFGDEIQSLTRILLCGLQSALPKSRELVFPISSYSQALPPIGTAKMLIA